MAPGWDCPGWAAPGGGGRNGRGNGVTGMGARLGLSRHRSCYCRLSLGADRAGRSDRAGWARRTGSASGSRRSRGTDGICSSVGFNLHFALHLHGRRCGFAHGLGRCSGGRLGTGEKSIDGLSGPIGGTALRALLAQRDPGGAVCTGSGTERGRQGPGGRRDPPEAEG